MSGPITDAIIDGAEVAEIKRLVLKCQTKEELDEEDRDGVTALMYVARSQYIRNDDDEEEYARSGACQKAIWARYKAILAGNGCKGLLEHCDRRRNRNWTLLMYSAKGGNRKNLKMVLGWYQEEYGPFKGNHGCPVGAMIDWVNVDHKVKDLIQMEVFAGKQQSITNYGTRRRRKRTTTAQVSPTSVLATASTSSARSKRRKSSSAKKSTSSTIASSNVKEKSVAAKVKENDDSEKLGVDSQQTSAQGKEEPHLYEIWV